MPAMTPSIISPRYVAVLLGLAVPCLAIGRLALALPLILAALMAVSLTERAKHWRWMVRQAKKPAGIMLILMFTLWVPSIIVSPDWLRSFEAAGRMILFMGAVALVVSAVTSDACALSLA